MASIPLVALQSKSPDPINIADEQAKVQAIQNQQQRGQMQQMELQQAKRDQQDQEIIRQAYMSSNGDLSAAANEAAKRGASPKAVLSLRTANLDAKAKALDLVTKQGAVAVQQADLAKGAHAAVDAAKPEDKPGVYQQQLQGLQQAGVDVSKFPQEYPGDEAFKFIGVHVQGYSKLIDEAAKQAEVDKNKAQAGEATAAMNKTNALLPSQVSEAGSKAVSAQVEAQNAPQKAALGLKETQASINEKNAQANKANDEQRQGTWSLQEDGKGGSVWANNKTREVIPATGVVPKGTDAKARAEYEKNVAPVIESQQYAKDYIARGAYTGAGDEALMEKFFNIAKPSTGFRMTQPQIDMLKNSQSWFNSAGAKFRHATKGTWFSDEQRKQIADTMDSLAEAKKAAMPPGSGGQGTQQQGGDGYWDQYPKH